MHGNKPQGWLDEASLFDTLSIANTFAHFEAERSGYFRDELTKLVEEKQYRKLVDFEIDYEVDASVSDFIHARQCLGFYQKLQPLVSVFDENLEEQAWQKFLTSERQCADTNALFGAVGQGRACLLPDVSRFIEAARWKIQRILGDVPSFSQLAPKLGPGASTTVKRRMAHAAAKLAGPLACSTNTVPWLGLIFGQNPHLFEHHSTLEIEVDEELAIVGVHETAVVSEHCGRLSFVDKDAKSKRTIVVEPSLSSFYQLGIGKIMEDRLRVNGIDITNQTTNQNLACVGSVWDALATLDLSSASDTISRELVRYLLPWDWYSLLDGFRSPTVEYRGVEVQLEKFSSMGNGFTFPLETLIFYALTWAASPHHERSWISAYGDDLVCSSERAPVVMGLLEYCGFTINVKKSYVKGKFRESCGADYLNGINIRPYRLKKPVSPEILFQIHNWYYRHYDAEGCALALSFIPPHLKIWGPDGYGDGHLLCPNPDFRIHKRQLGWGGYTFDTYTTKAKRSVRIHPGDYLQVLYSIYARGYAGASASDDYSSNRAHRLEAAEKHALEVEFAPEAGSQDGRVVKTYPSSGQRRYKRISIYTLSRG